MFEFSQICAAVDMHWMHSPMTSLVVQANNLKACGESIMQDSGHSLADVYSIDVSAISVLWPDALHSPA